jgi:transaldolase
VNFSSRYIEQTQEVAARINTRAVEQMALLLKECRERGGRLFLTGCGGGAGHASHAVCDFRKLCGLEAYCPTDNVSELTARINDEGWESSIANWLRASKLNSKDCLFIFSVGGGNAEKKISMNLVAAVQAAKEVGATVLGVVGRDGGYTAQVADACVIVPTVDSALVTPHTESFQAVVWHLLASHPLLQLQPTKWESTVKAPRPSAGETSLVNVKIFADGAEINQMRELYRNPMISGFTTNPTLMRKAGVRDYRKFALEVLQYIPDRPISFEVFSDEFAQMEREALEIASWGENVYVKIPVSNTRAESSVGLIKRLCDKGVKVNVTAIMTLEQVMEVVPALRYGPPSCVSVFAGRIADTGIDPLPLMAGVVDYLRATPQIELIWASPRELFNVIQADRIGCHILTATPDILKKLTLIGKDLSQYSVETVRMFYDDACAAGYSLEQNTPAAQPLPVA